MERTRRRSFRFHLGKYGARARNRLDVHAYQCVGVAARNRQMTASIIPCYGRLPPARAWTQRVSKKRVQCIKR